MRKLFAVLKREYLQAVRKKMFIFMTLFFPVLMTGVMALPMVLMANSLTGKKVAVIDGTGQLRDAFTKTPHTPPKRMQNELPVDLAIEFIDAHQQDPTAVAKSYLGRLTSRENNKLDAVLVIPSDA